jgi:hypothetical protein
VLSVKDSLVYIGNESVRTKTTYTVDGKRPCLVQ